MSSADADALRSAAESRGLLFTTLQTGRYMASTQAARAAIDAGRIGGVRMASSAWTGTCYPVDPANWRARPDEGGVFLDVGEHAFDLIRWLMGADIVHDPRPDREFRWRSPYPEPSAMAQLEFANGALGQAWITFEVPWPGLPRSACRVVIVGETGILDVDSYGESWLRRAAKLGRAPAEYLDTTDFGHTDLGIRASRGSGSRPRSPAIRRSSRATTSARLGKFVAQLQEIVDALRRASVRGRRRAATACLPSRRSRPPAVGGERDAGSRPGWVRWRAGDAARQRLTPPDPRVGPLTRLFARHVNTKTVVGGLSSRSGVCGQGATRSRGPVSMPGAKSPASEGARGEPGGLESPTGPALPSGMEITKWRARDTRRALSD